MNTSNKSIVLAGLLMASITACKNDTHLPELIAGAARQSALNGGIQPGSGKKYTLLTEGLTIVDFFSFGVTEKNPPVAYRWYDSSKSNANPKTWLPVYHRTYLNNPPVNNSLHLEEYMDIADDSSYNIGGKIRDGYLYKDAKGRCYKMDVALTPLSGPKTNRTYLYTYNDKDQLVQWVNAANQTDKATYTYDAHGDLIQVDYMDGMLATRVQLGYEPVASAGGKILDLSHLNPEFDPQIDRYLSIYGTFSKHLVHRITILHPSSQSPELLVKASDQYFSYILNEEGYVTQRQRFKMSGSVLLATDGYTYKVDKIGLNP